MIRGAHSPMRIGFDVAQTCGVRAGCAWYADSLIQAMATVAPEHQYTLYHRFGSWLDTDPNQGTLIEQSGVSMPYLKSSIEESRALAKQIAREEKELPGNPQIVQSNSFQAPKVGKAKLVVVVYDVSFWVHPEFTTESNRLVCQRGICEALQRADGFLFISQSSMDEFERILPGWLARHHRHAAAIPLASRMQTQVRLEIPGESCWLSVGSLEPRKNYETLLAALEMYWQRSKRRIPLHLAGGDGWRNERLLAKLAGLESAGMVKRLGYVPDEALPGLYAKATALLFPSWYEGFGLPVLEAMQCGCPVLCSDRTSLPEIGGNAVRLIDPSSAGSICEAMLEMESDAGLRRRFVAAGREQAKRFSWETAARDTLDFYRKVLTDTV